MSRTRWRRCREARAGGARVIPSGLYDPLMTACDGALVRVLASGATERAMARELLAADAFVTFAFEAAANEPSTIVQRADAAMRRISSSSVRFLDGGAVSFPVPAPSPAHLPPYRHPSP